MLRMILDGLEDDRGGEPSPAPWYCDDHVVRPGDGGGMWFVFDADEEDGPIGWFDREADARFVVAAREWRRWYLAGVAWLGLSSGLLLGFLAGRLSGG